MTTTGILGGRWRATISPSGAIFPVTGRPLRWFVAAEDRWHDPSATPSTRQRRIDGTPVTETRVKIPGGDAVQRIWSTADGGGTTWVEVHNSSPRSIAVAFDRADLLVPRPPANGAIGGIDLPTEAVSFPIGHAASTTVGIAHDGSSGVRIPSTSAEAVVRGWTATAGRASTLVTDASVDHAVTAARCDLLLADLLDEPGRADESWLVAVGEMARMGQPTADAVDIAAACERLLRRRSPTWERTVAYEGAAVALTALGEERAVDDLRRAVDGWRADPPALRPEGVMVVPWAERRLVGGNGALLPIGWGTVELGSPIEVHGVACGPSRVSFAVRWHGERPAVLWEVEGDPLTLTAPVVAPGWTASAQRGEALWPAPTAVSPGADG